MSLRHKAVGLFSGGLDSILAAIMVKEQGFEVHLIHFVSPFFGYKGSQLLKLEKKAEDLGMIFHAITVGDDYIDDVIKNNSHGLGKNINACIDCHKFMLVKAKQFKERIGALFVFTGEVVGQRPMSQTKKSLNLLSEVSGLKGYLLRPLSAKLLEPTIPEQEGVIERSKLLNICGRGRKIQREMAKNKNIGAYPQPAGGCRFTDPNIVDKFNRFTAIKDNYTWRDLSLLLIGRHFDLGNGHYLVVTRDESELEKLSYYTELGIVVEPSNRVPGPTGLLLCLSGDQDAVLREMLDISGSIVARYTDKNTFNDGKVKVSFLNKGTLLEELILTPINEEDLKRYRL